MWVGKKSRVLSAFPADTQMLEAKPLMGMLCQMKEQNIHWLLPPAYKCGCEVTAVAQQGQIKKWQHQVDNSEGVGVGEMMRAINGKGLYVHENTTKIRKRDKIKRDNFFYGGV